MNRQDALKNIRIVLDGAVHPGNIGAAARAMKTMGLARLYLVAPQRYPDPEAAWRASRATDILESAVVCATLDEAVAQVRQMAAERLYCWANMVVATPDGVAALEVRGGHVEVERNPVFIARANHHICLGATPQYDDTVTTAFRYQTAFDGLRTANSLDDIFTILRSHHPTDGYGVCNHGLYETVYSYVVHWNEGETTFYALQGDPCEGGAYVKVPVELGQANDLSGYPSRHAVVQNRS